MGYEQQKRREEERKQKWKKKRTTLQVPQMILKGIWIASACTDWDDIQWAHVLLIVLILEIFSDPSSNTWTRLFAFHKRWERYEYNDSPVG